MPWGSAAAAVAAAPLPRRRSPQPAAVGAASSGDDAAAEAVRLREHEALLAAARALPPEALPAFVESQRERLTTAFLAFVSERARGKSGGGGGIGPKAGPSGVAGGGVGGAGASREERAALAELASRLIALKEEADWESSRRALPPLAASLAYSNYARWAQDHPGQSLGEVAPGVSLEDVYRAGEREELKLQRQGGRLRERSSSTLDDFAARGPGAAFGDQAAMAMARVKARLLGYQDDGTGATLEGADQPSAEQGVPGGSPAGAPAGGVRDRGEEGSGAGGGLQAAAGGPVARRVLRALLEECTCREERAQAVAEACVPPGLLVTEQHGARVHVVTTPASLLAAIAAEQRRPAGRPDAAAGAAADSAAGSQRGPASDAGSSSSSSGGGPVALLPSGESAAEALAALAEDVAGYDEHVWSRLSPLERYGLR